MVWSSTVGPTGDCALATVLKSSRHPQSADLIVERLALPCITSSLGRVTIRSELMGFRLEHDRCVG